MPTMVHQRKLFGLREARVIWRMKHVLKLPVTKIAVALERNKTSAYRALGPNFKPRNVGAGTSLLKTTGVLGAASPRYMSPLQWRGPGQNPLPGG